MRESPAVPALALALLLSPGVATRAGEGDASPVQVGMPRAHDQLREKLRPVRTVGLLEARVDVFELGAGGQRTVNEDGSVHARKAVAEPVAREIAARGYAVKAIEDLAPIRDDLPDVRLLYDAVRASIVFAVYQQHFPTRVEHFDYALGDLSKLLDAYGVDALAFVHGTDEVSSAGRKAAQGVSVAGLALLGFIAIPHGGVTRLDVGLVDRAGCVLWFNVVAGRYDLADVNSTGALVSTLLSALPVASAP